MKRLILILFIYAHQAHANQGVDFRPLWQDSPPTTQTGKSCHCYSLAHLVEAKMALKSGRFRKVSGHDLFKLHLLNVNRKLQTPEGIRSPQIKRKLHKNSPEGGVVTETFQLAKRNGAMLAKDCPDLSGVKRKNFLNKLKKNRNLWQDSMNDRSFKEIDADAYTSGKLSKNLQWEARRNWIKNRIKRKTVRNFLRNASMNKHSLKGMTDEKKLKTIDRYLSCGPLSVSVKSTRPNGPNHALVLVGHEDGYVFLRNSRGKDFDEMPEEEFSKKALFFYNLKIGKEKQTNCHLKDKLIDLSN